MKEPTPITFPVGRLVQGSLYTPNTLNAEGKPLLDQSGNPRVDFFFALAIEKKGETHWNQTEWGAKIWGQATKDFPAGQYNSPNFAWKITDGDSRIPDQKGNLPVEKQGFAGHWIIKLSGGLAPAIYSRDLKPMIEKDAINPGDYIHVAANVVGNSQSLKPGVYINHHMIAFMGYGERIVFMAPRDATAAANAGLGQAPVPAAASAIPTSGGFTSIAPAPVVVTPHTAILNAPIAPAPIVAAAPTAPVAPPVRVMLPAAEYPYDAYIASGWTDEQLIAHGKMQA